MASKTLIGHWKDANNLLGEFSSRLHKATEVAMKSTAINLEGTIKKGIRDQAPGGVKFKAPSKMTLASREFSGKKGRTKALIVDSDLLNSITHKADADSAFVGIKRSARSKKGDGKKMINIAEIQEKGFGPIVIPFTPKAKRYLFAMMKATGMAVKAKSVSTGTGKNVIIVYIPPRSYLVSTFKKWKNTAPDEFRAKIAKVMEDYGN